MPPVQERPLSPAMDFRPDSCGTHNASLTHDRQVLTDLGLPLPRRFHQVLDCSWLLTEQCEKLQACRFRQGLAEVRLQSIELLFIPAVICGAAGAGYTAFLFGQAEGRDFWQSPLLLPILLVQALLAGSAALSLLSWPLGPESTLSSLFTIVLLSAVTLHV